MSEDLIMRNGHEKQLSIFTTPEDQTTMDITLMSDFISNGISRLANSIIDSSQKNGSLVSIGDFSMLDSALKSGGVFVHADYEYILDFDSLPKDILEKYRKGEYKLGDSRQVRDNLRAVIVDKEGTRVKDVTLKKTKRVAENQNQLQNIAIQRQLKEITEKLDTIIQLQDYHIDFSRNNALVKPFFDARDYVVYAQNEQEKEKADTYIDKAIDYLTTGLNAIYIDLDSAKKHFLWTTRPPIRIQSLVDRFVKYMTQDLQLAAIYNGVLSQLLEYSNRTKDLKFNYDKYRRIMTQFYTVTIGRKNLPISLQIHNAVKYSKENPDAWKKMTDEIAPKLTYNTIEAAYIVTGEGD